MVLGKLPVPGRPTIWITVGQGPTALAVGAGGGCLDNFTLIYPFFPLSPSLWETARYRLKYCLKGPLNPKPTNQPIGSFPLKKAPVKFPEDGLYFQHFMLIFVFVPVSDYHHLWGWSGGAMALGKLPVPGRPTILITVGQGPIALAVGAGGGGLDIFTLNYPFFSLFLGVAWWCYGPA